MQSRISFIECLSKADNRIFAETINQHHAYVKFKCVPQRRINWLVTWDGELAGVIGLSSCVIALSSRDAWIGWTREQRLLTMRHTANNYRFCLIPGTRAENLGSSVLAALRRVGQQRWREKYGDELVLLETYVQPDIEGSENKRNGAVYLADNWILVGRTLGNSIRKAPVKLWQRETGARGELARVNPEAAIAKYACGRQHYVVTKSFPKRVFVKPLVRHWKSVLCPA